MSDFLIQKIRATVLDEIKERVAEGERLLEEAKKGQVGPDHARWVSSFSVLVELLDPDGDPHWGQSLRSSWWKAQWLDGNDPKGPDQQAMVFAQRHGIARSLLFGWARIAMPERVSRYGHVLVANVGDGVCCEVLSGRRFFESEGDAIVDWGTQPPAWPAIAGLLRLRWHTGSYTRSPQAFLLTHYHQDHYNALLQASLHPSFQGSWKKLRVVYVPGLPKIPQRSAFYQALMSVNAYLMGADSGHYEFDLLKALGRLAGHSSFRLRRLFRGDRFKLGPFRCVCGWPPRELQGAPLGKRVRKALDAFADALEAEPRLRQLHATIAAGAWPVQTRRSDGERPRRTESPPEERRGRDTWESHPGRHPFREERQRSAWKDWEHGLRRRLSLETAPVSKPVEVANRQLRQVANELGLAFVVSESVLCLGDLQGARIRSVVEFCERLGYIDFDVLIAAHHGTAWSSTLRRLRAKMTVVSAGRRLRSKFRGEYKIISKNVARTHQDGDIGARFEAR